jgi:hypothetical protein
MGIPDFIALVALVLGAVDVVQSNGKSATAWGVVLLAISFLWHLVPK